MTEIEQYATYVKDMRDAQKKYFHVRDQYWLTLSKQREKQVDELTKSILEPDTQQKLF